MNAEITSVKRITAEKHIDADGNAKSFLLRNSQEQIILEPGKAWAQLDVYKWVTRGLMAEPHGFHVLPNGAVQIHGEQIEPEDLEAVARLEAKINQRFEGISLKPAPPKTAPSLAPGPSEGNKVKFKVRLDKLGHLMVMSLRSGERTEIGIRGLDGLVREGLMLKPKSYHVDPLLRYVEIDELRFDSDSSGAEALENRLNNFYAPVMKDDGHAPIEIRANSASASGFDIHFVTTRAGARFDVKGHLAQEQLDILQDTVKCQLLRPGIVLRISPPHLIIRRRGHNGSEERIPELPDVHYLRVTAAELQGVLNHPLIRRNATGNEAAPQPIASVPQKSAPALPVDHIKAVIEPPVIKTDTMPVNKAVVVDKPPVQREKLPAETVSPAIEAAAEDNAEIRALFRETDPLRINTEIFQRLEACLGLPVQDVWLSLEMVFQDRRFKIISFTHADISSVMEIRSEEFWGFYLSHINEHKVLLDFAFHGKRVEWGPHKCFLQTSMTADPEEYNGSALLGMALPDTNHFVFVVAASFKKWIQTRERLFEATGASFITIDDLAAAPEKYPLVWPVP